MERSPPVPYSGYPATVSAPSYDRCMAPVRRDTRGIVDAAELFTQVDFRRVEPAEPLRRHVEQYWLIDWNLTEPYVSHVVPHPAVNIVFQQFEDQDPFVEVAGVQLGLFAQKLEGRGRVCGVKFRPGGFRPFAPDRPVTEWTGRRIRSPEVFPDTDPPAILSPDDEKARITALDTFLLGPGAPARPTGRPRDGPGRTHRHRPHHPPRHRLRPRRGHVRTTAAAPVRRVRRRRPEVGHPALPHPRGPGARGDGTSSGLGGTCRRPRLRRPGPSGPGLHGDGGRPADGVRTGRALTGRLPPPPPPPPSGSSSSSGSSENNALDRPALLPSHLSA
nr:transcriptional regulator [Streptomyces sp. MMG1533]